MDSITPALDIDSHRQEAHGRTNADQVRSHAAAGLAPAKLLAAAVGASVAAAIVAALALHFLLPPQKAEDPRVPALARDVDDMKQQLMAINDRLRTLDTGAVSAAETIQELRDGTARQVAALDAVRHELRAQADAASRSWEAQGAVATPALMGVAVVQLRQAIERGQRFDWEVVNLWGIAGNKREAAAELGRLTPLVRGVSTNEQIQQALEALNPRWNYGLSGLQIGVSTADWLIGLGPGSVLAGNQNVASIYRAVALVKRGDEAEAAHELRKVTGELASRTAPVIASLDARVAALGACGRLMLMAKEALAAQGRILR